MKFKYYVLNYDANARKVINFNIFDNILVQEHTEKAVKKYLNNPKKYKYEKHVMWDQPTEYIYGFKGLCEEIRSIIIWKEWSRREYEISVGDAFETDCNKLEKWDCYKQAEPNIEMITREVIYQYKAEMKKKK